MSSAWRPNSFDKNWPTNQHYLQYHALLCTFIHLTYYLQKILFIGPPHQRHQSGHLTSYLSIPLNGLEGQMGHKMSLFVCWQIFGWLRHLSTMVLFGHFFEWNWSLSVTIMDGHIWRINECCPRLPGGLKDLIWAWNSRPTCVIGSTSQ